MATKGQGAKGKGGRGTGGSRAGGGRAQAGSRTGRKASRDGARTAVSREVYGIAAVATSLVLGLTLAVGSDGMLVRPISAVLRYAFGVGAYLLPVLLLAWGLTFFFLRIEWREDRVAAGLAVMFLSAIGLAHMAVPMVSMFDRVAYESHGGVVGAALAYGLTTLLGQLGSYVVLLAGMLAGAVLTSLFSVSGTVERLGAGVLKLAQRQGAQTGPAAADAAARKAASRRRLASMREAVGETTERLTSPVKEAIEPAFQQTTEASPDGLSEQLALTQVPKGEGYHLPPMTLLKRTRERPAGQQRTVDDYKRLLVQTLADFDVEATIGEVVVGPTVTVFEVVPAPGVKVGRIQALSRDIGLALATSDVRIAPVPGKAALGVEVPNEARDLVTVGDVLAAPDAAPHAPPLTVAIGKDTAGNPVVADLGDMPHLLIAGATGQGKSVSINAILVTLLMRTTPAQVRLILIDPKRIELAAYRDLPHLLVPVVVESKKAASALQWAVAEMEHRYRELEAAGVRKLDQYNAAVAKGTDPRVEAKEELPYIVIVIDELADLMMISSAQVEGAVQRLSQMARAVGIHLVLATQRPSTDVITGLIKANITTRVAMKVGSSIDSRVILDSPGADKLVGKGDMLLMQPERGKPLRVQGAFVSEEEIEAIVTYIKSQAEPEYHEEILEDAGGSGGLECDDPMLEQAIEVVLATQMGSTSMLQRRLKLGYTRAARLMDMMEQLGIVGPPDGSKPREVLMDEDTWRIVRGERLDEERS